MSKYGNIKTKIDGITFASKKEAQYYLWLKQEKKEKRILDFDCQVPFELQPKFTTPTGEKIRAIKYVADYVVYHNGKTQIIDTKGYWTDKAKMKWKMVQYMHRDKPEYILTII